MSVSRSQKSVSRVEAFPWGWIFVIILIALAAGGIAVLSHPQATTARSLFSWLFAWDSVQVMWYLTRAAGIIAYLLLWLSTAWGLVVPSKILDKVLHRSFTFDFHQFISLLSIGFLALHIIVLTADKYLPYSVAQILVPFLSPYRPVWVGVGVIAFYLVLLVTATFYIRQRIGMKTFRYIHYTSLLAYLGATVHGIMAGTDSSLPFMLAIYIGSFLIVVFLMTYWLIMMKSQRKRETN